MQNEVILRVHKYVIPMYVMVSVPEVKEENIYQPPIILGCFKTREDAKAAWKARTPEYKFIKAKTVHVYYFNLRTDVEVIPEKIFFCGSYKVSRRGGELNFSFIPDIGSYTDIESYNNVIEWLSTMHVIWFRESCERSNGWEIFYASNEMFCIECPVDKLVNIPVLFTDVVS